MKPRTTSPRKPARKRSARPTAAQVQALKTELAAVSIKASGLADKVSELREANEGLLVASRNLRETVTTARRRADALVELHKAELEYHESQAAQVDAFRRHEAAGNRLQIARELAEVSR